MVVLYFFDSSYRFAFDLRNRYFFYRIYNYSLKLPINLYRVRPSDGRVCYVVFAGWKRALIEKKYKPYDVQYE